MSRSSATKTASPRKARTVSLPLQEGKVAPKYHEDPHAVASVKSARRVLELLELLASAPRGLSFSELVESLALPKSSLYALLRTLTERHWLQFDDETRRYWTGVRGWRQAKDTIGPRTSSA